jgi:hypothetical protein
MSYSVGKDEEGVVLIVGSPGDGGFTSTLTMNEGAVVQMIKLLAATLDDHTVTIEKRFEGLLKAGQDMSDKGYQIGTPEGYETFKSKREGK